MTEEQEQLIETLNAASQGISAAVKQQTITPTQIYCLLHTLIRQLAETLNHQLQSTAGRKPSPFKIFAQQVPSRLSLAQNH